VRSVHPQAPHPETGKKPPGREKGGEETWPRPFDRASSIWRNTTHAQPELAPQNDTSPDGRKRRGKKKEKKKTGFAWEAADGKAPSTGGISETKESQAGKGTVIRSIKKMDQDKCAFGSQIGRGQKNGNTRQLHCGSASKKAGPG